MELEQMQAEMNMLFNEMILASDERKIVLLLLLADLTKGMNSRAGMLLNKLTNEVGDSITTVAKPKEDPQLKIVD